MSLSYKIGPIIEASGNVENIRNYLSSAPFFDVSVLKYHDEALKVWRSVAHRFAHKESVYRIPYSLAENPKLYALDALTIAAPLIKDKKQLIAVAEIFTIFYLIIHYFDDHVEHPDKFFSKFDFSSESNLDAQRGAAPFSFVLLALTIIGEILEEQNKLSKEAQLEIINAVFVRLASQTRYFTQEKQTNLTVTEVLEIKAREVSGKTLGILADLLKVVLNYDAQRHNELETGLLYLGSVEQFTDDIRDISVDSTLMNANIVIAASDQFGFAPGNSVLDDLYHQEVSMANKSLAKFYSKSELLVILSLPYYPFMIDKRRLLQDKRDR